MQYSLALPYRLVLGSGSPRRRELLEGLGLEFSVEVRPVNEELPEGMEAKLAAESLAAQKAAPFHNDLQASADLLLLTADTVVSLQGQLLAKPADEEEAKEMLRRLSGRQHEVVTGFALSWGGQHMCQSVRSVVHMSELSEELIHYYVSRFRPMDKAGAYGIQEFIGMAGVEKIEGCFYNIMGLPTQAVYATLSAFCHENH